MWVFRRQINPSFYTILKSKGIDDLNINPATIKLAEEKVGKSLECIGTGNNFLNRISVTQTLRSTINKWDLRPNKPGI